MAMCELWLEMFPFSGRTSTGVFYSPKKVTSFSPVKVPGWEDDLNAPKVPFKAETRNLFYLPPPQRSFGESKRQELPVTRHVRPRVGLKATRTLRQGVSISDIENAPPKAAQTELVPSSPKRKRQFPDIILDGIMQHVTPLTDESTYGQWECIALVCRSWRNAALRARRSSIRLKSDGSLMAYFLYRTYVATVWAEGGPRSLTIDLERTDRLVNSLSCTAIKWLVQICPLRQLDLRGIHLTANDALFLIGHSPHLRDLTISYAHVTGVVKLGKPDTITAQKQLEWITTLEIRTYYKASEEFGRFIIATVGKELRKLTYSSSNLYDFPSDCPKLAIFKSTPSFSLDTLTGRHLPIRDLSATSWTSEFLTSFLAFCPHLEKLTGNVVDTADDTLFIALQNLPNLTDCSISLNIISTLPFKDLLRKRGKNFKHLDVSQPWVDASVLECVSVYCANLETLHFGQLKSYTKEDVADVGRYCYQLRSWTGVAVCSRWFYEFALELVACGRRPYNLPDLKVKHDGCRCKRPACYLREVATVG
ncbi:hypothetical protein HK097_003766 [Rhizophlyctis rosea]|uniref:Uncharacterized protein n=1 Tax=Rhizophlyctis rosea TaxID=64517 RepID=A0AAD5S3R6_9FUNG|nr:hypothetical protein HK097_003766 [Rhizophlyctis rosea]